jgi:hypothetical protein
VACVEAGGAVVGVVVGVVDLLLELDPPHPARARAAAMTATPIDSTLRVIAGTLRQRRSPYIVHKG